MTTKHNNNRMNPTRFLLVLVSSLVLIPTPTPTARADDFLSPIFSPIFDGICDHVGCGQGSCKTSTNSTFGYECQCKSGWSQLHIGDSLRFLPCVIPNCSIDYSCSNNSSAPAPAPSADNGNFSLLDPCSWSYCGGGSCIKTSDTGGHKCKCDEGFTNLLNVTSLPCYKSCSLGANCANLGLNPFNSSSLSPPAPNSVSDITNSSDTGLLVTNNLSMLLVLIPLLLMIDVA